MPGSSDLVSIALCHVLPGLNFEFWVGFLSQEDFSICKVAEEESIKFLREIKELLSFQRSYILNNKSKVLY